MPPFSNREPWRRNHDNFSDPAVLRPQGHFYPASRQELIDIVNTAEALDPVPEVRASGSHWALSGAAETNDFIIETQTPKYLEDDQALRPNLNKPLYEVTGINGCLSAAALRFFISQGVTPFNPMAIPDSKFYIYHVESGTRIYELYSLLDFGDDLEPRSLAAELTQYKGPWALPTMGGAGGQTIVGAFSTGTHGGDVSLPPIADAVQAMHLIGPQGNQYWLERQLPNGSNLVDDAKLTSLYGKIEILRDPDLFNSVIVAAGRMGIIYSVVLRVVRQFALNEDRISTNWSAVKSWVNVPSHPNFINNHFVQVVVNPNAQVDNKAEHSSFVTLRKLKPLNDAGSPPAGRKERVGNRLPDGSFENAGKSPSFGSGEFFNSICASDSPVRAAFDNIIGDFEGVRDKALIVAAIAAFFDPALAATSLAVATTAETVILLLSDLRDSIPPGPLGSTIGYIWNWAAENDHFEYVRRIADIVFAEEQSPHTNFLGISYALMDLHNYQDIGCSANGDSLEVFFDASSPNLVAYVEKIFQRITDLANGTLSGQPMAFAGYVSLRYMSQSAGLIAMQKFGHTCALEIAGFQAVKGTAPFLSAIEMDAVEMGGTVHWGQRNNLDVKMVENMYGWKGPTEPLFRWRKTLSHFSANGRFPTFSTAFTRDRGLEIIQPLIQNFSVKPTADCAGSRVEIEWTAANNPPETVARLEIRPPGSSGPPTSVIPLGTLDGSQQIVLPEGNSNFDFVVALTKYGRTLTDKRTVQVRGFQEDDIWTFEFDCNCVQVDGIWRWGIEIPFSSQYITDNLRVKEIYTYFTPFPGLGATWLARTAGILDTSFNWLNNRKVLITKPILNRSWTFFYQNAGCLGVTPHLHVEFKISCGI